MYWLQQISNLLNRPRLLFDNADFEQKHRRA